MAMGGSFYAQYVLWIEPNYVFSLSLSVEVAMIAIIGGLGTPLGPVIGAVILVPSRILLRNWIGTAGSGLYLVVYGLFLILVVLYARQGLSGYLRVRFGKKNLGSSEG